MKHEMKKSKKHESKHGSLKIKGGFSEGKKEAAKAGYKK